jgi:lysophospholipase L1-like esterase
MSKPNRHLIWLLVASSAFVFGGRAQAQQAAGDACLAFKKGMSLGTSLARTRTKLQAGEPLVVVALGSSSTTGFGLLRSGGAFPDVMKQELLRLRPSARIELINSGRIMENISENVARLDSDVLRYKPDLVVWQLGSNDAVWRGIADNAKEMLNGAVKRLKAANADVILVDLQYAPLVLLTSRHAKMEKIIAEVAREQNVGQFPRFTLMKKAIDGGVSGLVGWDGLHKTSEGHRCVGKALGQMIDTAAR